VAAISDVVRQELLRYADDGGEKIVNLPPAIDTNTFTPVTDRTTLRERLGLPVDQPLIGLIAQFVPWKRHHLFLDMLEQIADRPWHAVLAGADLHHDAAYLAGIRERITRPPLAGRVTWLPWQDQPAQLLAALDLCVLTSSMEPFGRVVAEAMACAVPVVAVAEGGPCEIIQSGVTGVLAPAEPVDLAVAVSTLLADPALRTAYGQAGRQRVQEQYSLDRQRNDLSALYEAAVGTR